MESLTILVCGATGRLGQLTAVLLEHGHQVRAATRDPHSARARALGELGAQIVRADFDTVESLTSAARSADVVFAAGTAHLAGPQGDIRHGKNIANAAHAAGVGHLVYVSVAGAEQPTGVPVFDSKRMVEEHIRRIGVPFTIIAPVYYMENLWNPWNRPALAAGKLPSAVPTTRRTQQICLADVVAFTTLVMEQPDRFLGARVEIAADEPTAEECARTVSQILGRTVEAVGPFPNSPNPLFEWLDRVGNHVDMPALHARYPEIGWQDFPSWAAVQNWRALATNPR
jgi:uncharacterized protein YbjT (DUF2867 family)